MHSDKIWTAPHSSTNRAQFCFTSAIVWELVFPSWYAAVSKHSAHIQKTNTHFRVDRTPGWYNFKMVWNSSNFCAPLGSRHWYLKFKTVWIKTTVPRPGKRASGKKHSVLFLGLVQLSGLILIVRYLKLHFVSTTKTVVYFNYTFSDWFFKISYRRIRHTSSHRISHLLWHSVGGGIAAAEAVCGRSGSHGRKGRAQRLGCGSCGIHHHLGGSCRGSCVNVVVVAVVPVMVVVMMIYCRRRVHHASSRSVHFAECQ